jgi:HNH endonuclease
MHLQNFIFDFPNNSDSWLMQKYNLTEGEVNSLRKKNSLKKDKVYIASSYKDRGIKISQKAVGRLVSQETKDKILATKIKNNSISRGKDHYNWKGGRAWERFKNPEYIAWRNKVLERDGYICQECKRECKKYEKGLAAHHIKEYAKYPELRFEISNGKTLCRKCHMSLHNKPYVEQQVLCACGCGTLIDKYDKYGRRERSYVRFHYKRKISSKRQDQLSLDLIPCGCGCGELVKPFDKSGREHKFVRGHSTRVLRIKTNIPQDIACACGCGKIIKSFNKWGQSVKYSRGHNMRKRLVINV